MLFTDRAEVIKYRERSERRARGQTGATYQTVKQAPTLKSPMASQDILQFPVLNHCEFCVFLYKICDVHENRY